MTAPILTPDELAAIRREYRGASLLPARTYHDPAIFDWELEHVLRRDWLLVARVDEVPPAGALPVEVGGEPVALVRDREGAVRASVSGEQPIGCATWQGFVFVSLGERTGPSLEGQLGDLVEHVARFDLARLRSARRIVYEVAANWKLIAENYSECYHCPGVHPQLTRLTPYDLGGDFDPQGAWQGGWMELVGGAETLALDGGHGSRRGRPMLCGSAPQDASRVFYYVLWPLAFLSIHPDYVLVHRLEPVSPTQTRVTCDWLFEAETMALPDFDPSEPIAFWDLTNRQDWHVCELQQRGTGSRSFVAGRYANNEPSVQAFDLMVAARYAGEPIAGRPTTRDRYDVPPPKPGTLQPGADADHGSARRPRRSSRAAAGPAC